MPSSLAKSSKLVLVLNQHVALPRVLASRTTLHHGLGFSLLPFHAVAHPPYGQDGKKFFHSDNDQAMLQLLRRAMAKQFTAKSWPRPASRAAFSVREACAAKREQRLTCARVSCVNGASGDTAQPGTVTSLKR